MKWPVARLIWESRGHRPKFVSATLQEAFPGQEGFSLPTIHRLSTQVDANVPDAVARVILALPIRRGFEDPSEVVRAGLEALGGLAPQAIPPASQGDVVPGVDPEVIARAVARILKDKLPKVDPEVIVNAIVAGLKEHRPQVDTEAIAKTIVAQLQAGKGSPLAQLARRIARLVVERLSEREAQERAKSSAKLDELIAELRALARSVHTRTQQETNERVKGSAKLDQLLAELRALTKERAEDRAKLDEVSAELRRVMSGLLFMFFHELRAVIRRGTRHLTNQLDRLSVKRLAVAGAAGGAVACAVGLLFVAASGHSRPPALAPEAAPQQVIIVTNMGPGGAPLGFDLRTFLGAVTGQMGEKVVDQYIPDRPLPNQKLPPCLGEAGESVMSGGCWVGVTDVKPPCGRYLFRNGSTCYRPVAADPSKRVGEESRPGQGEPTREQPRPMQKMPGREER